MHQADAELVRAVFAGPVDMLGVVLHRRLRASTGRARLRASYEHWRTRIGLRTEPAHATRLLRAILV